MNLSKANYGHQIDTLRELYYLAANKRHVIVRLLGIMQQLPAAVILTSPAGKVQQLFEAGMFVHESTDSD